MARSLIAVLAWGVVVIAAQRTAEATTIRVPEDYASVLAAVDAAVSGDSVLVGPGTWTDKDTRTVTGITVTACAFPKGGVTILGTSGADATVIDAQEVGPGAVDGISYSGYPGSQLTLEGLTITGGGKGGAGIYAESSGLLVVRSCKVSGMGNLGNGHAILIFSYTSNQDLLMEDSEVSFNAGSTTTGIQSQSGSLEIYRSRFEGNAGIAVFLTGTTNQQDVTIQDCEFLDNRSGHPTVLILDPFTVLIERNAFIRNTNTSGGGAALNVGDCFGPIRHNIFAFDSTLGGSGTAIYTGQYGGAISENTFVGCHVEPPYGASVARLGSGTSNVDFRNNIITNCTGGSIATVQPGETPRMYCNGIWENEGGLGGYVVDPSDRFLDPLFCDPQLLDFTLSESSPYAPANSPNCGQVGAFGPACGTIGIVQTSWGKIKSLYR
jgi:hypothetical protein